MLYLGNFPDINSVCESCVSDFIVPAEQVQEGTMKWVLYVGRWGCVWMCVVNIGNPVVDWSPLLHTLTDRD